MKYLKPVLAVLLLACLLPMPYGFFMLVRFVAMVAFALLAYDCYKKSVKPLAVTFASLALLFQPFAKIALGRVVWNVVDVAVAVFLIFLWHKERKGKNLN